MISQEEALAKKAYDEFNGDVNLVPWENLHPNARDRFLRVVRAIRAELSARNVPLYDATQTGPWW